jgi:tetrahydromethanopterin S-methyltransferase subunit A
MNLSPEQELAFQEALRYLQEAIAAEKCQACGCFHNLLPALEQAFPKGEGPRELREAIEAAKRSLMEQRYDCLGCEVCIPPLVLNALTRALGEAVSELEACPAEKVEERPGWPPLPGAYQVLRYQAPVAVCTLTSEDLAAAVVREAGPEIAIVGTMHTENLGIERLIQNVVANPHLRFLVLCGADSHQAVGHYPGQSLLALAQQGTDDRQRIIGAPGRRPLLKNISLEAVVRFREVVEVIDLTGETNAAQVLLAAEHCGTRNPGPAEPYALSHIVTPLAGYLPARMVSDPAGYFVVYVDRARGTLSLEHYRNDGLLDTVIEGNSAAELYTPVIDRGLISRLDHAAYLGQELAKAENALGSGTSFIQDAAPEQRQVTGSTNLCTCGTVCHQGVALSMPAYNFGEKRNWPCIYQDFP